MERGSMETWHFLCPGCQAPLKLRPTQEHGLEFRCPECNAALMLVRQSTNDWRVQYSSAARSTSSTTVPQTHSSASPTPKSATPSGSSGHSLPQVSFGDSTTSKRWAWAVGMALGLLVLGGIVWFRTQPHSRRGTGADNPQSGTDQPAEKIAPPPVNAVPGPASITPETRLKYLGTWIQKQQQTHGTFPRGSLGADHLPPERRLGWLSNYVSQQAGPTAPQPLMDRSWSDPAQEPFVRRAMPEFQNPNVESLAGEDGYPATHFVGISGIGRDAAELPGNHPRAGIFGHTRTTKSEDVRDGLANTMLLAGVTNHLGSWAAADRASYRSFIAEPYVNGPDGFGTGQSEGMFVLMADGSVRTISAQTHPRIVRRLAAMADGLPLDDKVPGEPGDAAPATHPMPPAVAENNPPATGNPLGTGNPPVNAADPPLDPIPMLPPLDIPKLLLREVQAFEQKQPAPVFKLLLQVEELAGVRIDYDRAGLGEAGKRLDQGVTLKLQRSSLKQVLDTILNQAQLTYRVEARRIVITTP